MSTEKNKQMPTYEDDHHPDLRYLPGYHLRCRMKSTELTAVPFSLKFLGYCCSIITVMIIYISLEESA